MSKPNAYQQTQTILQQAQARWAEVYKLGFHDGFIGNDMQMAGFAYVTGWTDGQNVALQQANKN